MRAEFFTIGNTSPIPHFAAARTHSADAWMRVARRMHAGSLSDALSGHRRRQFRHQRMATGARLVREHRGEPERVPRRFLVKEARILPHLVVRAAVARICVFGFAAWPLIASDNGAQIAVPLERHVAAQIVHSGHALGVRGWPAKTRNALLQRVERRAALAATADTAGTTCGRAAVRVTFANARCTCIARRAGGDDVITCRREARGVR